MSIDLSEFHDVFFEECGEGLDVMETGLLELDHGTDVEEINAIFRAAHSIKGGAGSFGFMEISGFTHILETLLDETRDGRRKVTTELVDLLLGSVDVLRGMVDAARGGEELDQARVAETQGKLEAMLAGEDASDASETGQEPEGAAISLDDEAPAFISNFDDDDDSGESGEVEATLGGAGGKSQPIWQIHFAPNKDALKTGNEPVRLIRALAALGKLDVKTLASDLPSLDALASDECHLGWDMQLEGDVELEQIEELFEWMRDECELTINQVAGDTPVAEAEEGEADVSVAVAEDNAEPIKAETPAEEPQSATRAAPAASGAASQEDAQKKPPATKKAGSTSKESGSLRVATDKVDDLINLVGELVITQSMLGQMGGHVETGGQKALEKLRDGLEQLERNTRQLQESVLQIRMLPISHAFSRYPRLVRDISNKLGKNIELKLVGESTEVDKTVLEKIGDPLVHLIRNSLDHGIETPDVRKAAGKPEVGTLTLSAYHEGGDIIIKVIDDGAGLSRERILSKAIERGLVSENEELSDERVHNLIFAPGFSTAEAISDVSGRGVGMDVVRRNVRDLGGNVSIQSNDGAGSTVIIRLPLTLAILDGQLVRVAGDTYILSLIPIVESLQMSKEHIHSVADSTSVYRLRDEYIPIVDMGAAFGYPESDSGFENGLLTVVESEGKRYGLFVDALLGQQQVVIKSLETNFRQVPGISGATILGDGTVALIIDVPGLVQRFQDQSSEQDPALYAAA